MQRLFLMGALLIAFGIGIMVGGVIPAVKAAPVTNTPAVAEYTADGNVRPGTGTPFYLNEPYLYQRWFLTIIPQGANVSPLVVLVDSQTGASFLLRPAPGEPAGLSWLLIDRKG